MCGVRVASLTDSHVAVASSRSRAARFSTYHPLQTSVPSSPEPPSAQVTTPTQVPSIPLPLPRALPPRTALLLLRIPIPPAHWPSHLEMSSPLLMRLSTALKPHGVAVNAVWDGVGQSDSFYPKMGEEEGYPADMYFADGRRVRYERLDGGVVKDGRVVRELAAASEAKGIGQQDRDEGELEIIVCTHGSRDCRCEQTGGALVRALREEIARTGVKGVKVGEVAHVGGHKYAANAILLPSLDMLSDLSPSHASSILSHILSGRPTTGTMWAHWRGRYGLTEAEQEGVWNGTNAAHIEADTSRPLVSTKAVGAGGETIEANGETGEERRRYMLKFRTYEGEVKEVDAIQGETLLQLAKRHGLPGMEGTCGGNLECATCHLYIPSSAPVPPESEDELDMLGYALGYKEGESRLGCQVRVTSEFGKWAEGGGGVLQLPRF